MDKKLVGCPQPALEICNNDDNDGIMFYAYGIFL